jgi:O-acetyl-ADP-ribose deacetylase (regulator of RNase III)
MTRPRMSLSFGERLELELLVGEEPPPLTGAMVVPQDIHLILGEVGPLEDTRETPEQVLATPGAQRPRRPGSVVVAPAREGAPLLLQAIVYDFDRSPPAREIHVFEALIAAFEEARTRGIRSVAVQPLGTSHAGLDPDRFLKLLAQVCYSSAELETTVRRVHLLLPSPAELERYEALLQALVDKRGRKP